MTGGRLSVFGAELDRKQEESFSSRFRYSVFVTGGIPWRDRKEEGLAYKNSGMFKKEDHDCRQCLAEMEQTVQGQSVPF